MPIVEIQGLGNVEFPDTMSHEDIVKAIQSNIMPKIQATQPAVGVDEKPITPSILQQTPKGKTTTDTAIDVAKDLGISAVQGLLGAKEAAVGVASIPTLGLLGKTEEAAEKALFGGTSKDAREALQKLKSEEQQKQEAAVSQTFKDKGVMAGLEEAVTSPRVLAGTVVESVPSMIGGAAIGRQALKLGAKALGAEVAGPELPGYLVRKFGDKLAPVIAGAAGESIVSAGSSAESTRQQNESGFLTPQQAALATLSGGLTGVFGILGGKVANKLGIGDMDTMLVKGTTKVAQDAVNKSQKSVIRKAFEGALSESTLEELPQSLQEQALQNIAQGKDWKDGLAEAGTMGFLAGGIMGGGAGALSKTETAPTIQDLHDAVKKLDEEQKQGKQTIPPTGETKTPPTEPRTVTQEQLMGHATNRLAELEAKANGVPAKETVDESGNKITVPEVPAQPMTEQETAELKFLQEQIKNPEGLAKGYGVQIAEAKPVSAHDTEAALGELEGKEMPVPPIFQQPATPTEPAKPETPETPPTEEGKPEEKQPTVIKEPPKVESTGKLIDNTGKEHSLPTVSDAQKAGFEFEPINSDKPMYAKTDLDGVMRMIKNLFGDKSYTSYTNMTDSKYGVTSDKNKVLPKTSTKNQVSVTFRPDTLSGNKVGENDFFAYDVAHKAIESFTIHNPGRLKVRGQDAVDGANLLDKFFTKGDNPDGSITYTLRRVKSEEEKTKDNERISKDYLEHMNSKRGKLTYKYKRLRKIGLNKFQESINQYETLGDALKDLLARLESAIANNEFTGTATLPREKINLYSKQNGDPALSYMSLKQAEMYVDIIKHLMKIDPVNKTKLFMDPYIIGGRTHTIPGFYNRVTNTIALFANTDIKTFVHESVHAATVHYIKTHPNDPKVKQLEKILAASRAKDRKVGSNWGKYGNTDLMEFIAEAFSNPDFIKHLMDIPPVFDKTEATSLFDNIKSIVRGIMKDVFGITKLDKTAFDEVMDLSDQMFIGKTLEGYKYDLGHPLDAETGKVKIESPAFKKWFGKSKILNTDGTPKVMYHGTVGDINRFNTKFIFVSDNPENASYFSVYAQDRALKEIARQIDQNPKQKLDLITKLVDDAIANKKLGVPENSNGMFNTTREEHIQSFMNRSIVSSMDSLALKQTLLPIINNMMETGRNIIPVYVKAENPFDYDNPRHVKQVLNKIVSMTSKNKNQLPYVIRHLEEGDWGGIESQEVQDALQALGFDGFYTKENDEKNLAVYNPNQIKSAVGNKGTYNLESDIITENQRPLTEEEANNEEGSRQIFNYRNQPVDIRKWEIPEQGPIATKLSKWFQEFADEHVILTKVSNAIRALNRTISDMSDMEKKQELKNSKISDKLLRFANEEVNPILKEMIEKGVSMEDINKYLHARHAEEYNNRMNEINHKVDKNGNIIPFGLKDRASGMPTQEANDYLNNLSQEREQTLKDIADKWYAIRDKTQQILVESGQETQETIDLWNEIFPDYVPLNREQEQQAVPTGLRTGVGIDTRGNFAKRAMGSEKQVASIVDALLYQRERAVARAENNEVGKSVYRLALENPNPDFWLPINPDAIRSREKLIQELEDMGYPNAEEIADNIMAEPKERYLRPVRESDFVIDPTTGLPIPNSKEVVDARISRNARFGDNVLTLKINGRERYVFFNQKDPNAVTMVRSLKNLDAQTLGRFLQANRFMNHYLGQVYTVLNPIFGIVNGIRDFPFGMANLSTTPIRGKQIEVSKKIMPAMLGIMSVLRKERVGDATANAKWQKIYKEATEAGFQTSNRYGILNTGEDQTYIQETLKKLTDNNAKQVFRYIINMTYDFASMIENGVRLAAYQQMRETTDPATGENYTPQKAASVAKNLTINFDKKGSRTAALRSLYLFFNASVRGTVRLAETLKGPAGAQIITGGMLLGVMQAMLMAGAGFKDDDPPEYIREHNLIIPTGDGKYITLPMPYGLNILPNTGRILTEAAIDVNKNGIKKAKIGKKSLAWANSFFSTFSPFGNQGLTLNALVPSAMEPIAGVGITNKNSFGQTISRQDSYNRPTPGYTRTKESGTEYGKELARWINRIGGTDTTKGLWSPTGDDIDFLTASVTGPVLGSIAKTVKYVKAKMEGEETPAYQTPVLGRFRGELESKPVITSRFYNNINAMYEHEFTLKNLKSDPEATRKYIQDHPDARAYKRAEHVEAQINALNAKKKNFQMRGAPKEALQRIDNQKIIIMNRFNDQLDRIRSQ